MQEEKHPSRGASSPPLATRLLGPLRRWYRAKRLAWFCVDGNHRYAFMDEQTVKGDPTQDLHSVAMKWHALDGDYVYAKLCKDCGNWTVLAKK